MKSFIRMAMCLLALGILVVGFVYVLGPTSLRNPGPGHATGQLPANFEYKSPGQPHAAP